MKPGRKLDILIAEKVMGLSIAKYSDTGELRITADGEYLYNYPTIIWRASPYSTDIAAAWEVVEKLNLFSGTNVLARLDSGRYNVASQGDIGFWNSLAIGDTAAHAICLAALKVVGVDYEKL